MTRLLNRVSKVKQELESILDDDADMVVRYWYLYLFSTNGGSCSAQSWGRSDYKGCKMHVKSMNQTVTYHRIDIHLTNVSCVTYLQVLYVIGRNIISLHRHHQ